VASTLNSFRNGAVAFIDWLGLRIKSRLAIWLAVLIASSLHGQAGGSPRDAYCERELTETEQEAPPLPLTSAPSVSSRRTPNGNVVRNTARRGWK